MIVVHPEDGMEQEGREEGARGGLPPQQNKIEGGHPPSQRNILILGGETPRPSLGGRSPKSPNFPYKALIRPLRAL